MLETAIMDAIDLDSAETPRSHSPYRIPVESAPDGTQSPRGAPDPAMIFATVTLLVASLIRLGPPFTGREAIGVEPTLALGVTLLCAWITLREAYFRVQERRAARRTGTMV
jgi:hypothetical protein